MTPVSTEPTPDATAPEPTVTGKYVGYLLLFVVLFFVLYIFPEILILKNNGFTPVEHLVDSGPNPTIGDILGSLWRDRAQLLNPMNNPLVRFFLVTIVVGAVFDQVKKNAPREDA